MRAVLADEQHQPVVLGGDEAMGAAKPPRCVYDCGRRSNLRLEPTTFGDVHHRQDGAIDVPRMRREKTECCADRAAGLTRGEWRRLPGCERQSTAGLIRASPATTKVWGRRTSAQPQKLWAGRRR